MFGTPHDKIFDNAPEAHVLRTKLESLGIKAYLFEENMLSLDPLISIALGGIKLKINERDFQKPKEIITVIEKKPLTNDQNEIQTCPTCIQQPSCTPVLNLSKVLEELLR